MRFNQLFPALAGIGVSMIIRSTGDDVWLYTYHGRLIAYGADYPKPKDISSILRTGMD